MDRGAIDYVERLRRLQANLPSYKLDFLLVTHLPNVRYLSGFTGSSAALLVSDHRATLFTDGRYTTQAREEVRNARIVIGRKAPSLAAAEWLTEQRRGRGRALSRSSSGRVSSGRGLMTLGIEAESMTAAAHRRLVPVLSGRVRIRLAPPLVERARMIKDAGEIERIREAVKLGASLFRIGRRKIRPDVSEVAVAAAMEYEARLRGAEGMSFPTILSAGPRSAIVHGRASDAPIGRRGFVVCDFGVILAGYCSDRTRTVHVGHPTKEAREFYGAVLEAQLAAIDSVRPGVSAAEIDEAARSVLRKYKLAQYFTHSTGHGLGLEVHEAPRLAAGQMQALEPGMVITIEPGAYVPGKWGVRIEDVVVVTRTGCEVLTPTDKDLVVI